MNKLIITVAVDCTVSFPNNPHTIPIQDVDRAVDQYVDAVDAGASIVHIHGVRSLEPQVQPDGRKVSRLDAGGWRRMQEGILSQRDCVMQFGISAARLEDRKQLMELRPDMMSVIYGPHDERFQPDPSFAEREIYASHTREELLEYATLLDRFSIRHEIECFHTGAYWNIDYVRQRAPLPEPIFCTIFLGWPGGTWTPPTPKALTYMVDCLPKGCIWGISVMDPASHWGLLAQAIQLGGHVRVGWEDNPYLGPGTFAARNAELVDKVYRLAAGLGREVAAPRETRSLLNLAPARTARP